MSGNAALLPARRLPGRAHERHPLATSLAAVAIGAAAFVAVATLAGWSAVSDVLTRVQPWWLLVAVGAQAIALGAYALAWRAVVARPGPLSTHVSFLVVLAGFGVHAPGGGLTLDRSALRRGGHEADEATVRVLGLGTLEYGVLAPVAWGCAVWLLATGADVSPSVLWPWAIAVPVGFAFGLWAAAPQRRERISERHRLGRAVRRALEAVGTLRDLVRHPRREADAWLGMVVYWAADIVTLYAALRLFDVELGAPALIVGYATGYAATRRSLPFGGVAITAALMSLALAWVGVALAAAVVAVAAYRVVNVGLPVPIALWAGRRLRRREAR
jgi:uncharacterized membrane protein YbhN (UPF0104 family)